MPHQLRERGEKRLVMTARDIVRYRLANQRIGSAQGTQPVEVVTALGAMQAQDYLGALWAVGLRLANGTEAVVERAIAEREIIRTWPMRGTLHFVAAKDVRWMLELLTPRIIAGSVRRCRELELDDAVFARARKLFTRALRKDRQLTRDAMMKLLEKERILTAGQRGYHILWRLAQEGLICCAARSGKQQTFALLEEWAPETRSLERGTALAELSRRYFTGHGPATLQDFVWWTGLKVSDARAGLDSVCSQLSSQTVDGTVYWMARDLPALPEASGTTYLLPGFDEYLLGYRDRRIMLKPEHARITVLGGNGMFLPTIVTGGRVAGIWKRTLKKKKVAITASPFASPGKPWRDAVASAVERYGRFLGMSVEMAEFTTQAIDASPPLR